MTVISMSDKEFSRLKALQDVAARRLKVSEAAALLDITRRQFFRLQQAFRQSGPTGLVSGRRGRPGNHCSPPSIRKFALATIRRWYADFGPTLAAEKLKECHGLTISRETIRQWMIAEGLWLDRKERLKAVHQPRGRRDCLGELVQADGSEHWWFEDRGPQCTLLVFIDDATSRLMHLKFVETESTFAYLTAGREYVERHGKPVAFYTDKHGVFRVNHEGATGGNGMTQFGRAMHEMNIDIICANSPQAKGRVERANKTLQDRLVKELRLNGINTIEGANALLPAFLADYNARFAKEPRDGKNLHRPLSSTDKLDDVFAWKEERTVSSSLTLQYDKVLFLLDPSPITSTLRRKRVTVADYPDGRFKIFHGGVELPFRRFDKIRHVEQGAEVENKRLGAVLSHIRCLQQERGIGQRSTHAPRRQDQVNHFFKVG
jgi:hypothetical protein